MLNKVSSPCLFLNSNSFTANIRPVAINDAASIAIDVIPEGFQSITIVIVGIDVQTVLIPPVIIRSSWAPSLILPGGSINPGETSIDFLASHQHPW